MHYTISVFTQSKLLDQLRNKDVILSGDGRCDSPGKSAKYCTYSLMDIETGYILHSETVDKREVALQSPNMEKEAFVRSLQFLHTHISCKEIITDASTSTCKEMGKCMLFKCIAVRNDITCSYKASGYISFLRHLA